MKISKDHSSLETLFREILSIVPVGITVIDATGRIVLCNPEAARIFGHELDARRFLRGRSAGLPFSRIAGASV